MTSGISVQNAHEERTLSAIPGTTGYERFFGKGGLQAELLRGAITSDLLLARSPGDELYLWHGGVWKPDGSTAVKAKVIELLGERTRTQHSKLMIENITVTTPHVIEDQPLPRWINFRNGMLDWSEGQLYGHNHQLSSINQMPYAWDENAVCPRTDQFLREVLHSDAVELGYEMIGYAMFDGNPLQKALLLLGSGANGKGVFLRLVTSVLGEENVSSVSLQNLSNNRFAPASLYGRLANVAGDLSSMVVQDSAPFKMITGGDLIYAERKFRDPFAFRARALPIFSTNEIPASTDTSPGYMRRWLVVEFPRTFTPEERDAGLSEALASERAGVAARAVLALRNVFDRGGFTPASSVVEAQREMSLLLSPMKEFFEDRVQIDEQSTTSRGIIYGAYVDWCLARNERHPIAQRRFWGEFRTELMVRLGISTWDKQLEVRSASQRQIRCVRIRRPDRPLMDMQ